MWCCWVGRYPGQAAREIGARQGLGIPVEAQPAVSFSGPLILYPCRSPLLAQKIWTAPNGAEKLYYVPGVLHASFWENELQATLAVLVSTVSDHERSGKAEQNTEFYLH